MVILCNYIKPLSHVNSKLDFLARGCLPLWTGRVAVVAESREKLVAWILQCQRESNLRPPGYEIS